MPRLLRLTILLSAAALLLAGCPDEPTEEPAPTPTPPETTPAPTPTPTPTPTPPDDEVEEGAWEELPDAPIATRLNHTATWADGLVIVWGGEDQETFEIADDGAAWDPGTGEWQEIPAAPVDGRWAHEAVWTGEELLVRGGTEGPDHLAACHTDGARYDPAAGEWQAIPEPPGESRCGASVVWADGEMLVFGGHSANGAPGPGDRHDDGLAYDPQADEWRVLPAAPVEPRAGGVAAWTGSELVIYGGHGAGAEEQGLAYFNDGAAYDPETDEWREIAESPLPPLSGVHGIAADGEVLVFGGEDPDPEAEEPSTAAAAYDPEADEWRSLADMPGAHSTLEAVWTGDVVYVLGQPEEAAADDAPAFLAYAADEDSWIPRPDPPEGPRTNHAMAWTGAELVVWGGQTADEPATGLRWDPPG